MSRRRYFVTYDISDDKRRTSVFKTLHGFGDHVQFSVFVCELNRREHIELTGLISRIVDAAEDQVLFIDLGPVEKDTGRVVVSVGRAYVPPRRSMVI